MEHFTVPVGPRAATLTAYLPGTSDQLSNTAVRPAVVVLPGGAYLRCSDREAEPVALAWAAEGYNAFVLRYTVGPGGTFAAALADAAAALAAVRDPARGWRVDPGRVAMLGFSAGGHLAAGLGTLGEDRPDALLLGYPAVAGLDRGDREPAPDLTDAVDARTPPTFLFGTLADTSVPAWHALRFTTALHAAGVAAELHLFETGAHGLALGRPLSSDGRAEMVDADFAGWLPLAARWLRRRFGDFPVAGAAG